VTVSITFFLITSARSAKIAKQQLRNKAEEVVENATGYECAISPAINDLNVGYSANPENLYSSTVYFQYLFNCIYANY